MSDEITALKAIIEEKDKHIWDLEEQVTDLELELSENNDKFEADEVVIEQIHKLYYDICEMVDDKNGINYSNIISKLDGFFKNTIEKAL